MISEPETKLEVIIVYSKIQHNTEDIGWNWCYTYPDNWNLKQLV